jgi:chromosome segregation ATPase
MTVRKRANHNDIVERLRNPAWPQSRLGTWGMRQDAAVEIERLRAELAAERERCASLRDEVESWVAQSQRQAAERERLRGEKASLLTVLHTAGQSMRDENERLRAELAAERERYAQIVKDWFTLAPRYRTREQLLADIRKG